MKKIMLFLIFSSVIILQSCEESQANSEKENTITCAQILSGQHELHQMNTVSYVKGGEQRTTASFFLITGSYESKHIPDTIVSDVYFYWKGFDSAYTKSKIPVNNLRIIINDSIKTPSIKFKWYCREIGHSCNYDMTNDQTMERFYDRHVIEAIVTCKSIDWPASISIPK